MSSIPPCFSSDLCNSLGSIVDPSVIDVAYMAKNGMQLPRTKEKEEGISQRKGVGKKKESPHNFRMCSLCHRSHGHSIAEISASTQPNSGRRY